MGIPYSSLQGPLLHQKTNEKCYPVVPYRPFTSDVHSPTEEGLVVSFKALPQSLVRHVVPEDTLWWTDAQFLPYSDCQLVVSTTPYHFRPGRTWIPQSKTPAGRILIYDISKKPLACIHLKGTSSSVLPRVHPHPLGEYIAFVESSAGVKVVNLDNHDVYRQPEVLNGGSCKCCALAPNGIYLATISRIQGHYNLRMLNFDHTLMNRRDDLRCHQLCPGFVGNRNFTDQVECKWSADSLLLAVCSLDSGTGRLFVVEQGTCKNICTIYPGLLEYDNSSAGSFDFDPRPDYSRLAVGTLDDCIHIIDVRRSEILQTIDNGVCESHINCIQYNNQGTKLAVAYGNLEINIFNPDTEELLHTIDVKASDDKLQHNVPCHSSLAIMRLCFNFTGSLLASSVCDGYVRVWSVPCFLSLQEFCKLEILRLIPVNKVKKLKLPEKIKTFLLSP